MSHVFPRNSAVNVPTAVAGEGCYLIDSDGKRYLDGSGGAAVSALGHGDSEVTEAIKTQLDRLEFAHTGFFSSEPAEALADLLIKHAPGDLDRAYFVSGGSEAVEASIKLARQYYLEIDQPQRRHIIARRQSYHGNTLGALAVGGNEWRRKQFSPLLIETSHVPPCYVYRDRLDGETEYDYGQRIAATLEEKIEELGAETVMAFILEPVVGATAGALTAVPGYLKTVREICDRHGVLLIFDEVMCGMGRTGTFFSAEHDNVHPDIIAIAKGLGAGYQPLGAMLCSDRIYRAIETGSGMFQHGHTFLAHPVACAAGVAVVSAIHKRQLLPRVREQGARLRQVLDINLEGHPHVGDIRGRGLFLGVELVLDKVTKEPFDPTLAIHKKLKQAAFDRGLICYPMGGTIDGQRGDHVLIAPPFIISDDQITELVEILSSAIDDAVLTH